MENIKNTYPTPLVPQAPVVFWISRLHGLDSPEATSWANLLKAIGECLPKIATRREVFAKMDLVHIQQQGYGLPAIAAGLCQGVARNICNTLFHGIELFPPIVMVGGASKNKRLVHYLEEEIHLHLHLQSPPDSEYMGGIGAALTAIRLNNNLKQRPTVEVNSLLHRTIFPKSCYYPPLSETKGRIPNFSGRQSYMHMQHEVEVDIYEKLSKHTVLDCYLGIYAGSTSTKVTLMNSRKAVVAGLYTRTSGQPIAALQKITRAIEDLEKRLAVQLSLLGTGTTGSGRKFIQKVARTEYVVDEITVMNYVCVAGTDSFIEEQGRWLGISLDEYAAAASGHSAPLISDRCTVFMQRDLNHLLNLGYSREELLAAALHSVRDNYLSKVAHINKIGEHIAFQGATAKNHTLVMAFEQKFQKPIYISRFCHLTGALGVCLKMVDAGFSEKSRFRKDLHTEQIVAGEYVCSFCNNHCKVKTIVIDGESLSGI